MLKIIDIYKATWAAITSYISFPRNSERTRFTVYDYVCRGTLFDVAVLTTVANI